MTTRNVTLVPGEVTLVSNKERWIIQNTAGSLVVFAEASSMPVMTDLVFQLSHGQGFEKLGGNCYAAPAGRQTLSISVIESDD